MPSGVGYGEAVDGRQERFARPAYRRRREEVGGVNAQIARTTVSPLDRIGLIVLTLVEMAL
jgi:hypothetical protein